MKIAFFSPLPPARSGIADYSAALLEPLSKIAQVDTFAEGHASFDPRRYDICIYQLGNNPYHAHAYETALKHPGIVVLHEANLHHLITDLTIRRNNWDAYMAEVEYDGGPKALEYAAKYVRTLQRGPDYDGVGMLKRVLQNSRGAIVHSDCVGSAARATGFTGPIGRIWHGSWSFEPERMAARTRLGLDEVTPLIGIFGFLKPYKRIAESLRAFRRLVRVEPRAKLILVGERHAELPLDSMIQALGIEANVRTTGWVEAGEMNSLIGACDVVLNLRYPTVGESSGTLLRSLSMGLPVVVSDVGSFSEYPDDIVLKVPVDEREEDLIFEYINLLISQPHLARAMGARARDWVNRECSWEIAARRYVEFAQSVLAGGEFHPPQRQVQMSATLHTEATQESSSAVAIAELPAIQTEADAAESHAPEILSWTAPDAKGYVESHITRLDKTLQITPRGTSADRVLEMGAYLQITPALKTRLGYGEVRGCYYGQAGNTHHRTVTSEDGSLFECEVDLFNAEKDRFPYEDGYFSTVLCCELIEHLFEDPMHMMSEINRILCPGGHFVVTTPNIVSLRAIAGVLQGYQPGLFPSYIKPRADGEVDARHNREYTPREISDLLVNSGFEVTLLETGPFLDEPRPDFGWVRHLLDRYILSGELRGDGIYAVGRKTGAVHERYPGWLYS